MDVLKKIAFCKKNTKKMAEKNDINNYHIPKIWSNYYKLKSESKNESTEDVTINPYVFFNSVFSKIENDLTKNISSNNFKNIYSMYVRTSTCWDHNNNGKIDLIQDKFTEQGTFMKSIALIPLIYEMGFNIIHLLPIFETSEVKKKGSLGSPYSVKNIMCLDIHLKDSLFADTLELEEQFKLFVEICHAYKIKVILDFPLRTVSRDANLISESPESLFWIKKEYETEFKSPLVSFLNEGKKIGKDNVALLYKEHSVDRYIGYFSESPNKINPLLFELLCNESKDSTELLYKIENEFGITTAPAYSDAVNDMQPQWSDISYLRIYDEPNKNFFLFDTINAKKFIGENKNESVWKYLKDAIPYYQAKYGIDGARIDMGHSLPEKLLKEIRVELKKNDSDFILICEELFIDHINEIEAKLYDYFIGNLWYSEQFRLNHDFFSLVNQLIVKEVEFIAASGTSDTPRTYARYRNEKYEKLLIILNNFTPNTIPFFVSGNEMLEIQPMNLGLISEDNDKYVLESDDKMYGRLAFFDSYQLHWENFNHSIFILLKKITKIKDELKKEINFHNGKIENNDTYLTISYPSYNSKSDSLYIVFSLSETSEKKIIGNKSSNFELLLSNIELEIKDLTNLKDILLDNEEIVVFRN